MDLYNSVGFLPGLLVILSLIDSLLQTQQMLIKTVFDVQTQQPGYAICDPNTERCGFVTYSITNAIKAGQCKNFQEVQSLINK